MIHIKKHSLEARAIEILLNVYPITEAELQKRLGVSRSRLALLLQRFVARQWIELEPLHDKTYIRLLRHDFVFVGRKECQKKALKHQKMGKKRTVRAYKPTDNEENIIYG